MFDGKNTDKTPTDDQPNEAAASLAEQAAAGESLDPTPAKTGKGLFARVADKLCKRPNGNTADGQSAVRTRSANDGARLAAVKNAAFAAVRVFRIAGVAVGGLSGIFYAAYVAYLLVFGKGDIRVNYCLLAFTAGYLLFFVVSTAMVLSNRGNKTAHKIGVKTFKTLRRLMILVNLFIVGGSIVNLRVAGGLPMIIAVAVTVAGLAAYIAVTVLFHSAVKKVKQTLNVYGKKSDAEEAV